MKTAHSTIGRLLRMSAYWYQRGHEQRALALIGSAIDLADGRLRAELVATRDACRSTA